jgi:hypothetical protein
MIIKSLLAASIVASTFIGTTAPAHAALSIYTNVASMTVQSDKRAVINPDSMKPKASKSRTSSNPTPHPKRRIPGDMY